MDDSWLKQLLNHGWETVAGALSALTTYMFYEKRKQKELQQQMLEDNIAFKIEIREMKEDIKDIKDWLFTNKKKK